ncbi:hypothetical protein PGT21_017619 [Puccinia graminis f. sp. tritici]|uniref:Retrotransposon gag domain-containing protein n=1 Tax=Puccinia graminis f. sp. tritici TaxID=56615 RepID=A0A5B0QWF6_PUCGR|nr:hypothetical protein PGT21_017619 [Puccinia graminis f. sp. tritici]
MKRSTNLGSRSKRRSNTDPNDLLPLTDPEAIIRSCNAKERRLKHLKSNPTAPLPPPCETTPSTVMSDETPAHEMSGSTRTADASDMQTAKDWFKSVFKIQHAFIVEAQADRRQAAEDRRQALEDRRTDRQILISAHQASAARISRLEELLLAMNIKNEVEAQPVQSTPGKIDLQKSFSRPRTLPMEILGNLIAKTNLQSFYANEAADFLTKSWEEFKTRLFDFALPTNWRSGLQRQICQLNMSPAETFLEYSTRACTLQSLFNFDASKSSKLGDLQLAQFVVYGLLDSLQDRINKRQLLEVAPFTYGPFEKQANASYMALQQPADPPIVSRSTPSAPPSLARDEFVWRVHSYLDLQGLCHFCKKHCGSAAGACPGPIDLSGINIPSKFATPAIKPADYVAPRAWGKPTATPGKPTQAPAGRPATCAASVAGITDTTPLEAQVSALTLDAAMQEDGRWDTYFNDEGCFPSLELAAVAALEDLDSQLLANEIEKAEQADLADAIAGRPGRA